MTLIERLERLELLDAFEGSKHGKTISRNKIWYGGSTSTFDMNVFPFRLSGGVRRRTDRSIDRSSAPSIDRSLSLVLVLGWTEKKYVTASHRSSKFELAKALGFFATPPIHHRRRSKVKRKRTEKRNERAAVLSPRSSLEKTVDVEYRHTFC